MLTAALEALEFTAGLTRAALDENRVVTLALVKEFEIIGEAARELSPALRVQIPLPWADIMGMRHRLVHGYFAIDYRVI